MPRVSVITPLYNKESYIAEAIRSVLSQTLADWEMIVVDNGSSDKGAAIARAIALDNPRVSVASYTETQGPGATRNFGLSQAQGEWILFLDGDDLIEPWHLTSLLREADAEPGAALIAGHWREFSGESPIAAQLRKPFGFGQSAQKLRDDCVAFAPWAVHATLVKRSALTHLFWWPEELDQVLAEDIHFWFRLIMENAVQYSCNQGALYRVHTAQRRNQIGAIRPWYRGNNAAVEANLQYMEQRGRPLTAGQCESLMRLYSELYWQAHSQREVEIAHEARQKAERWLAAIQRLGGGHSWTIRARRMLGLRLYLTLRYGLLGKPAHWSRIK